MKIVSALIIALLPLAAALAAPESGLSFAQEQRPAPPDYAAASSWAARPGAEGQAARVPQGAVAAARAPAVDVFYVHPTTDTSKAHWNQSLDDAKTNAWTDTSVIARQASAFNGCCRIYAPRYRQASSRAFSAVPGDGERAYALAYEDVLRAFDHYLAHDNKGRPFILVGHSQGGLHVTSLLRDRVDGTPLARRMVAAYVLGYGLSVGDMGTTLPTLKPCTGARDTGCVLGWNSFLEGSDTATYVARTEAGFVAKHGAGPDKTLLCSNVQAMGPAPARGIGALMAGDPSLALKPRAVTAQCRRGVLVVKPDPALKLEPLPGGNMHYHDIGLFYGDVRADAIRRSAAFLKRAKAAR